MRLKQFMFAFVAMLSFTFSALAQTTVTTEAELKTAMSSDGAVVLGADIELKEAVVIPKKVAIVLDLNGHKIEGVTTGVNGITLEANASLTINDSKGTGVITAKSYVLNGAGGTKIILNAGKIYRSSWAVYTTGSFTINGGTVECNDGSMAIRVAGSGTITLNGGTVTSVQISGGTLNVQDDDATITSGIHLDKGANDVNITAGTVNGNVTVAPEAQDKLTVSGGTFENPDAVKDYLEDGLVIDNGQVVAGMFKIEGTYYRTFAEAIADAQAGETITLLADLTMSEILVLDKSITLDLNGKKVTSTAKKAFEVYADATIKNGAIEAAQRCVDTRKAVELTLTDVTLIADEYTTHGNPQPLTIGGSENGTKVVMTNVNISAAAGYGIITFVETELTATESAISGYNALYVKPGSDNSTFNFVDSDLSGSTVGNDVEGNSFSTIAVRANNVAVNVDAESSVTANGNHCYAISFISESENTTTGSSVTVAGEITGNILDVPNGNTVKVKPEYADELAAAGYATIEAENGLVAVFKPVAKIGDAQFETLAEAVAAAQAGDDIKLLADATVEGTLALPAGIKLTSNGHTINGSIRMLGDLELNGPLTITGGLWVGKGGETLTATLSGGKLTANYFMFQHGTYTINADIDAVYGYLSFEGTFEVNSTIHTTGANGEVLYINGNVTLNDGAVLDSDNSVFVSNDNAVLTLKPGSKVDSNLKITKSGAKVNIDATGMTAGASANITGTVNNSGNGTIAVVGNDKLEAQIVDGKIVLAVKPVAKIGDVEYATLADAVAAAESGATITLMNGEHELPLFSGKELTFVGESKEGVIVNDAPAAVTQGWLGSTFHFENLTAKGATENYHGLANGVVAVTYKNCNINGLRFLYATEGVSFEGCAFNADGVEHSFWTYGASNVTVKNSTFTYTDRAVNCYSENGAEHEASIAFEGCSFTYAGTKDAPEGAVEINSGSVKSIDLTMNGCTAPEKGAMWFNSQWDSKKGENTVVSVDDVKVWPLVAQVGETKYATLNEAVAAVEDGGTITMIANETFTENNRYDNGGWWDGLGYSGDKSFTIDLNNFTISQDGALNDYLMWFKNDGAKDNTITLKNGTLDAGTTAYSALATASSNAKKITVNLENISLINNNSNGSTVKVRGGAVLNVKDGTVITGKDSYLGVECSAATVNIYDGAEIYMNGTSSYNGCLAGAGGNGTINVYGGKGLGKSGGFIAMTSGGTINVEGGEWTANTDGAYANDNKSVLVAQSDKQYNAGAGNSIVNVTGGTFKGGYNCYGNAAGDAQINISGGNFNADPATYLAQNYVAVENNGVWNVELAAAKIGETAYATLEEAFAAAAEGATITLLADATPALTSQRAITKAAVIDLGGNTLTLTEDDLYFGTTTFKNGTIVVDPSVYANTAVFWMFANQTLTFDDVDIIATGLTGTYLIGINDGTGSSVNLLNGSSITIDNSEKAELSTVIADNGNGNSVIIKDSKIDVKNVDARLYLGGQNGSVTIENSDIVLNGVKEGFYLRAGQTLAINGTSKVDITLNADTKPRYGINMTDATATYTKAETATVNATVYAPAKGSNSFAYTKEENGYVRVWGEGGGNAKKSYELKLYSGETLIATTKLNNIDNVIDGDVYVTWNFYYPESNDEYWTTTWEEGHPNSAAQPTEVELYIDGTLVATTAAKMSGADDVAPVVWRNLGGVAIANLLGEGTETSPYLISNKKELMWLQAKVDELAADGSTQFAGKYFKLTADIDLAGEDWNPIGSMSGDHGSFKGVFDGGDHTISNLKVEQAGNGIGLFARTTGNAVIKNLKLYNVSVKSTDNSNYAGAVVGNAYASTKIENVHVSGNVLVSGRGYIGGIAGHGYVVMDNVSVVATGDGQGNDKGLITSTFWCAGGILGYAGEGATNIMNANVENVVVTSAAGGLGAIVGMAEDNNGTQPISGSNLSAKDVEIKTYIGDFGDAYANYGLGYLYGGNPTSKLTGELSVENVTLTTSNGVAPTPADAVAKVNNAIYFSLQEALNTAAAGTGNVTVTILRDVDLTGIDWNPVTVSAAGYPVVTVEGNNKTITGLNDMLFAGTWAGKSGLIIKDLTIANSAIVNDKDDAAGTVGVGAFIGFPQASETITLENCHLKNSKVEGGHWTGGLIGYAAGYAGNDGPVFMNLTINNCSVTESTITGKGSVGGIIGHGSGNGWTNVVIEKTTVKDNTITSTGSSNVKAGAIMGTIGAAGQPTTANGVTKTGGATVSATVAGNTVTSNGTVITTIYGRQGTSTGQLYVAGGSYDNYPIEQGVAYAAPIEGYVIVKNDDNTYGLDEKVELPEVEITDIKGSLTDSDPDLTFALNFTIKDLENLDEEYLNKVMEQYGSWYTDYVLTISGLTDENVTFNANGNGDGYLAGQYDAFGANWVSVPFENVTLANNESIYIMEYAAKLMGQSGLRYTLAEIVSIVMDFDCGVYFTPEFLTANPGLKVDLHLKVFTEDAEGNKVNDINVATNEFDVKDYVAIVHADGKQTAYCTTLAEAVAAAEADETITLIADVELTETLNIPAGKTIALDLNGKTVSMADASGKGAYAINNNGNLTIVDNSEAKTGKITFNSTTPDNSFGYATSTIGNAGQLTVNSGTIENTTVGGASYAIDGIWHTGDVSLTINGGTIVAHKIAVRQVPFSATAKNVVTVKGGTLTGATAGLQLFNTNNDAKLAEVNIHGGKFNGTYAFYTSFTSAAASDDVTINIDGGEFNGYLYLYNGNNGSHEYPMTVSVTGGTFNGGAYIYTKDENGAEVAIRSIAGGTFANDVTVYCVDGYLCEANGYGTYSVVADPNYIAELVIDDAKGENYTNDTEKTVGKLTYVRTLPAAGIWYPVFLPFDVPVAALDAELFDVARINDFHTNFSEEDGSIEKMWVEYIVRKSGTLAAGQPFLVRAKNSNVLEMVIELEDVTLYPADKKSTITVGSVITEVTFEGVYESLDAPVSTPSTRYLAVNAAGVWDEFDGYSLNPFRVMMTLQILDEEYYISSAASLSVGARIIGEENEDGTTTIYDVEVDRENCEDMIFDLQGRRVLEPEKGGIYIKNGKKIIF